MSAVAEERGTRRGLAARVDAVTAPLLGGTLPVRLRAWDGSLSGPAGAPTVHLASPDALRRLLARPGELGLAQAYVTGEIDVEGDLLEGSGGSGRRSGPATRAGRE